MARSLCIAWSTESGPDCFEDKERPMKMEGSERSRVGEPLAADRARSARMGGGGSAWSTTWPRIAPTPQRPRGGGICLTTFTSRTHFLSSPRLFDFPRALVDGTVHISCSGGYIKHIGAVFHRSKTPANEALSAGEAELNSAAVGFSESVGMTDVLRELVSRSEHDRECGRSRL